jgi:hypothetical protein
VLTGTHDITLTQGGFYTLTSTSSSPGPFSFQIVNEGATLALDTPVQGPVFTGEQHLYRFTGNPGDHFYLDLANASTGGEALVTVRVLAPDGSSFPLRGPVAFDASLAGTYQLDLNVLEGFGLGPDSAPCLRVPERAHQPEPASQRHLECCRARGRLPLQRQRRPARLAGGPDKPVECHGAGQRGRPRRLDAVRQRLRRHALCSTY